MFISLFLEDNFITLGSLVSTNWVVLKCRVFFFNVQYCQNNWLQVFSNVLVNLGHTFCFLCESLVAVISIGRTLYQTSKSLGEKNTPRSV